MVRRRGNAIRCRLFCCNTSPGPSASSSHFIEPRPLLAHIALLRAPNPYVNKIPSLLTCNWCSVQCDEGHPVCRNCVKSKRECLGYDPVFRPQPAPSAIQPAPNPAPSLVVNPQDPPSSYPAAPPGYVPASSQPFAPSVQSDSSAQSHEQLNRTGAEPSVEGSDTMSAMASVQDAVDGSLSQTAGTPSATAPSIARPPSGQFGKQGWFSSTTVVC